MNGLTGKRTGVEAIFVLGVMPRSGTNYLYDLLALHPDCGPARAPIWEDFFLQHADLLMAYTAAVRRRWDPDWGSPSDDLPDRLHEALGDGLVSFLCDSRGGRLLTKTPSVRNIDRFFTLFPRARLLVLLRDGRSVVQSCMSTFGLDFDTAARRWARAADEVRRFDERHRDRGLAYRLVRYEELLDDLEESLAGILDFLDLDRHAFDFEAAARLPVRGSSVHRGAGRTAVHWKPVERDASFDPRARWRAWPPALHQRFDWIAGGQLRHFGYEQSPPATVAARQAAWQHVLDWRWQATRAARLVGSRLRG